MPRESGMETGEVPNRGLGRLEAYWTRVLERVKKQSEARHSKEGAAAWSEDPLSRDDSAIDADKEQRFPLLKLEQLNDQQRPFADAILKVSSIGISGPFNMMLRSPVKGQRMFAMLDYLRFNTSGPSRRSSRSSRRSTSTPIALITASSATNAIALPPKHLKSLGPHPALHRQPHVR